MVSRYNNWSSQQRTNTLVSGDRAQFVNCNQQISILGNKIKFFLDIGGLLVMSQNFLITMLSKTEEHLSWKINGYHAEDKGSHVGACSVILVPRPRRTYFVYLFVFSEGHMLPLTHSYSGTIITFPISHWGSMQCKSILFPKERDWLPIWLLRVQTLLNNRRESFLSSCVLNYS